MAVTSQPQTAIGETPIEDVALEAALEAREKAKDAASKARKAFKEVDDDAKARIRQLELGDAPARVGRFVIGERDVPGRSVSFESEPATRITIRLAKDEPF
jgi:hypothetical protein